MLKTRKDVMGTRTGLVLACGSEFMVLSFAINVITLGKPFNQCSSEKKSINKVSLALIGF